jgi:hypothetical protein
VLRNHTRLGRARKPLTPLPDKTAKAIGIEVPP